MTSCTSPTGPVPMPIGQPNVAGIRGPAPVHHQLDRLRCLAILRNIRRTTILLFAKLLRLCRRLCQTSRHRRAPRQSSPRTSTVPCRCQECVWFRPVGGDRSCMCCCCYRPSLLRLLCRISDSGFRSRPSCIHHRLGPGRQPHAWIWPPLTPRVLIPDDRSAPGVHGRCGPWCCELTGEVVASDLSTITSRISPLNPQQSPVPVSVVLVVVESLTSYEAPVGVMDVCLASDQVVTLHCIIIDHRSIVQRT